MAALVGRFAVALAIAAMALAGFGVGAIVADHRPAATASPGDGDDVWCC
jgi:hypothetical protein